MNKFIFMARYRFAKNYEDPKNYDLHSAVSTEKLSSPFTNLHPKLELTGMLIYVGFQLNLI
jgi:hypothetical protein